MSAARSSPVKGRVQQIANAVASSYLVGVAPALPTNCKRVYELLCKRVRWLHRHQSKISSFKLTYEMVIWALVVFMLIVNGVLFIRVLTHSRTFDIQHIREFRQIAPSTRGNCAAGYELTSRNRPQLFGKSFQLLHNFFFRLLTGRSVYTCKACTPGHSRQAPQTRCEACQPGFYQNARAAGRCLPCHVGTFQNTTGGVSCQQCSPGSHQPKKGQGDCTPCPEGSYQPHAGGSVCHACPLSHKPDCRTTKEKEVHVRDSDSSCFKERCGKESEPDTGGFLNGFLAHFDRSAGSANVHPDTKDENVQPETNKDAPKADVIDGDEADDVAEDDTFALEGEESSVIKEEVDKVVDTSEELVSKEEVMKVVEEENVNVVEDDRKMNEEATKMPEDDDDGSTKEEIRQLVTEDSQRKVETVEESSASEESPDEKKDKNNEKEEVVEEKRRPEKDRKSPEDPKNTLPVKSDFPKLNNTSSISLPSSIYVEKTQPKVSTPATRLKSAAKRPKIDRPILREIAIKINKSIESFRDFKKSLSATEEESETERMRSTKFEQVSGGAEPDSVEFDGKVPHRNTQRTLQDCDFVSLLQTNDSSKVLEMFTDLASSQASGFAHRLAILVDSEVPVYWLPVGAAAVTCYMVLAIFLIKKAVFGDVKSSVFTHITLVTELIFVVTLATLEERIPNPGSLASLSLVYGASTVTFTMLLLDCLEKAIPGGRSTLKVLTMLILPLVLTASLLLSMDCNATINSKHYHITADVYTVQVLVGLRGLIFPATLGRIDCEVNRRRRDSPDVKTIHVMDFTLEVLKILLLVEGLVNGTFLKLITLLCVNVTLNGLQLLVWELVTPCNALHLEEDEETCPDKINEITQIKKLRLRTRFFTRVITGDNVSYTNHDDNDSAQWEEEQKEEIALVLEKSGPLFDRCRELDKGGVVVYLNKKMVDEMVSFNSTNECKLYLAHMTGSNNSLELESAVLQKKEGADNGSDQSSDDFVVVPKIVVNSDEGSSDNCLCKVENKLSNRRKYKSVDDLTFDSESSEALSGTADILTESVFAGEAVILDPRRCQSSLWFNTGCVKCRKTKL